MKKLFLLFTIFLNVEYSNAERDPLYLFQMYNKYLPIDKTLAVSYLDSSISLLNRREDQQKFLQFNILSAKLNTDIGRSRKAIENLSRLSGNNIKEAFLPDYYVEMGRAFNLQAKYDLSINFYFNALIITEQNPSSLFNLKLYLLLCESFYNMKDQQSALYWFDKAINYFNTYSIEDRYLISQLIKLMLDMQEVGLTEDFMQNNFTSETNDSIEVKEVVSLIKGIIHFKNKRINEAIKSITEGLAYSEITHNLKLRSELFLIKSEIFMFVGRLAESERNLNSAQVIAIDIGDEFTELKCFEMFIKLYSASSNYDKLIFWQDKFINKGDHIYNEKLMHNVSSIQADFNKRESKKLIVHQGELLKLSVDSNRLKLYLTIVTIIIIALLMFILFTLYRVNKKRVYLNQRLERIVKSKTQHLEESIYLTKLRIFGLGQILITSKARYIPALSTIKGACHLLSLEGQLTEIQKVRLHDCILKINELQLFFEKSNTFK